MGFRNSIAAGTSLELSAGFQRYSELRYLYEPMEQDHLCQDLHQSLSKNYSTLGENLAFSRRA